jgi:hypothetical protein
MAFRIRQAKFFQNTTISYQKCKNLSQEQEKDIPIKLSKQIHQTCVEEGSSNIFSLLKTGSVTIEASLAAVIFLVFFLAMVELFFTMDLAIHMQRTLEEVSDEVSEVYYLGQTDLGKKIKDGLEESEITRLLSGWTELAELWTSEEETGSQWTMGNGVTESLLRMRFISHLEENMDGGSRNPLGESILEGKTEQISFAKSRIDGENGRIILAVTYPVPLPVSILNLDAITVTQYSYRYAWIGDEPDKENPEETDESEETELVYVTEDSEVYHRSVDCTYLRLSIRQVDSSELSGLRNQGGGKYYACELCKPDGTEEKVYITDYGNRYHVNLDCSGLKRTYKAIPLEEAENLRPCSRCGTLTGE